jgi:hypothetical protein
MSFEELEEAFQGFHALLANALRDSGHGIPLCDHRPSNGLGDRAAVVIRKLARCRTGFVVEIGRSSRPPTQSLAAGDRL